MILNRRISFETIIFFILTTILIGSIGITISYQQMIKNVEKASNAFYEDNSIFFYFTNTESRLSDAYLYLPEDVVLYTRLRSGDDIRAVLLKDDTKIPFIYEGRSFNQQDFISTTAKKAIVGKQVYTIVERDIEYYYLGNVRYEVVGRIGLNFPTRLDSMILLTMNESLFSEKTQYILSGDNLAGNYEYLGHEELFGDVIIFDGYPENFLHQINMSSSQNAATIIFLFILVFNLILSIYYWIESKEEEIIIKRTNGFNHKQIVREIFFHTLAITLLSTIIGSICSVLLIQNLNIVKYNFILYIIPIVAIFIPLLVIAIFEFRVKIYKRIDFVDFKFNQIIARKELEKSNCNNNSEFDHDISDVSIN